MTLTISHKVRVSLVLLVAWFLEVYLCCWHYNKILKATAPIWILARHPVILFTFGFFACSRFELRLLLWDTTCCDDSPTHICSWLMIRWLRVFNKVPHYCVGRLMIDVSTYSTIVTNCLTRFDLAVSRAICSCWSCAQLLFDCARCWVLSV